jgi:transcriptional regulator with XRE-family HTH domain
MNTGLKIKALRLEKKLEQTELADLMGMSSNMVSMYELGKKTPSLKAIQKMANVFGVSVNYFLDEENNNDLPVTNESITEKLYSELKFEFDFLRRNFERVIEENGRLSRTLENLSSNFQGGNNQHALQECKVVTLTPAPLQSVA